MKIIIGAAIIEDNKILLVRKKETWILVGGKLEDSESDLECLLRECKEELSGTELKNFRFYKSFEGISPHKKELKTVKVYFANLIDGLNKPSKEIEEAKWIDKRDLVKYNLSSITLDIVNSLKKENYL